MSTSTMPIADPGAKPFRPRRDRSRNTFLAQGEPSIWGTGGALAVALGMIVGLLILVLIQGGATFWPRELIQVQLLRLVDGKEREILFLGEVVYEEDYQPDESAFKNLPEALKEKAINAVKEAGGKAHRRKLRTGNEELTGVGYQWISDFEIVSESRPEWALVIERIGGWGKFFGAPVALLKDEREIAAGARETWDAANAHIAATGFQVRLKTADGTEKSLPLSEIVRAYPANQIGFGQKVGIYFSRWNDFLFDEPRSANTEGGVWPAIWSTVMLTLLMSIAVVPFGVLAALYLREYAKSGVIISMVRIAINNLAGVPSIVFGVFGFGFFCLFVGKYIDKGPDGLHIARVPPLQWWLLLTLCAVLGVAAFLVSVAGSRKSADSRGACGPLAFILWLVCLGLFGYLIFKSPYFQGFYPRATGPVYGTGGILWGALTLALLTLPVVIVATEEALAAVPNSMREGSYACGASKWQTIRRIVLPRAMPGVMTGVILAMARGAGEVAPLIALGGVSGEAAKLAVDFSDWDGSLGPIPTGPIHANRGFMHLGYHIYFLGFQVKDPEAARPLVFTTTLLLITIVATMTMFASWLRSCLRRRFKTSQF
jgi:ABC-type phosphate transport system permease subunit